MALRHVPVWLNCMFFVGDIGVDGLEKEVYLVWKMKSIHKMEVLTKKNTQKINIRICKRLRKK